MIVSDSAVMVGGALTRGMRLGLALADPKLEADDLPHCYYVISQDQEIELLGIRPAPSVGMLRFDEGGFEFFSLGADAVVTKFAPGRIADEAISRPEGAAPLLGLGDVAGTLYAVGLDYQVYRRLGGGRWDSIGPTGEVRDFPDGGFNAIHGSGPDNLYAAGWRGEVWHYDGRLWRLVDNSTNLILTGVLVGGDGRVTVCGRRGYLRQGEPMPGGGLDWVTIDLGGYPHDLWSIAAFRGALYAASRSDMVEVEDGEVTIFPDFGGNDDPAEMAELGFGQLSVADGYLCSVGERQVFLFDGQEWTGFELE